MHLQDLVRALDSSPHLASVGLDEIAKFLRFTRLCKPAICVETYDISAPPSSLPPHICDFIAAVLSRSSDAVQTWWTLLRYTAWDTGDLALATEDELDAFFIHGLPRGIAYRSLFPPVRVCSVDGCAGFRESQDCRTLGEPSTYKATLYTLRSGALPIFTTSLYCRHCRVRYYPDYRVHKASSTRTYYDTFPDIIQVATHFFIEAQLLELFVNCKVYGWLSSSNCARIYNEALAMRNSVLRNNKLAFPAAYNTYILRVPPWKYELELRSVDVLNGFFIYSLLLDHAEHHTILVLPHDMASQAYRLEAALAVRNKAMEGTGQEAYTHACDICFVTIIDENGKEWKVQAAIGDGTTLGHPCCGVHNCKIPLASNRDRFCPGMSSSGNTVAVIGCGQLHVAGRLMCSEATHRTLDDNYFSRHKSLFNLDKRWKQVHRAGCAPSDSISAGPGDINDDDQTLVEMEIPSADGCDTQKSDAGNRKLRALFGRRRIHNEQIIARPCGVILSRAPMYGAEQLTSVIEHAKATFPTEKSTPEYFFYDNNCHLREWLENHNDTHFKNTAFPVDVFHFRTKHKETHDACQRFCNPAAFPELIKDGKWLFNSSICEQTNVWLGGYNTILREMETTRYNFYLDEMIKRP